MALSRDIKIVRYGTPGNSTQPVNQPLTASAKVYRGSVATTRSGYLIAATAPAAATDIVWGLIEKAGPGKANTDPGITDTSGVNGGTTVEIATGTFFLASDTGGGAITQADVGKTCYLLDEKTVTLTAGTLPVAGVIEAYDTSITEPGPVAVKLGTNTMPGGPS